TFSIPKAKSPTSCETSACSFSSRRNSAPPRGSSTTSTCERKPEIRNAKSEAGAGPGWGGDYPPDFGLPVSGFGIHAPLPMIQATKNYLRFIARCGRLAFAGDWRYYAWMGFLSVFVLLGINAWARQFV